MRPTQPNRKALIDLGIGMTFGGIVYFLFLMTLDLSLRMSNPVWFLGVFYAPIGFSLFMVGLMMKEETK